MLSPVWAETENILADTPPPTIPTEAAATAPETSLLPRLNNISTISLLHVMIGEIKSSLGMF